MSQPSILSSNQSSSPGARISAVAARPRIMIPAGNQSPHSPSHYNNNPLYIAPTSQPGGTIMPGGIVVPPQPPMTPVTPWVDPFGRYPTKASEFMFKQFSGFKDFTMNTAKSGLSVGEKCAFWMYNKISTWSRKWFTHMFLFVVIIVYSVVGALVFVAVEGPHEQSELRKIRAERVELIEELWEMKKCNCTGKIVGFEQARTPEEQMGEAVSKLREFENHVITNYLKGVRDKGEIHADWTFWNAVFYCGTIYTTIGRTLDSSGYTTFGVHQSPYDNEPTNDNDESKDDNDEPTDDNDKPTGNKDEPTDYNDKQTDDNDKPSHNGKCGTVRRDGTLNDFPSHIKFSCIDYNDKPTDDYDEPTDDCDEPTDDYDEPSYNGQCGAVHRDGTLSDFPCYIKSPFICEHTPNSCMSLDSRDQNAENEN